MTTEKYSVSSVVLMVNGFDGMPDLVNDDAAITIEYDEDRGAIISDILGNVHATFTQTSVGKITLKYHYLSDAKTRIMAQMNAKISGLIILKNLEQLIDLRILSNCIITKIDLGTVGKSGATSPVLIVTFQGKLTVN